MKFYRSPASSRHVGCNGLWIVFRFQSTPDRHKNFYKVPQFLFACSFISHKYFYIIILLQESTEDCERAAIDGQCVLKDSDASFAVYWLSQVIYDDLEHFGPAKLGRNNASVLQEYPLFGVY